MPSAPLLIDVFVVRIRYLPESKVSFSGCRQQSGAPVCPQQSALAHSRNPHILVDI